MTAASSFTVLTYNLLTYVLYVESRIRPALTVIAMWIINIFCLNEIRVMQLQSHYSISLNSRLASESLPVQAKHENRKSLPGKV